MYPVSDEERARMKKDFTYHPPRADQIPRYEEIRDYARTFAATLLKDCPPSRERSLALTAIEKAVFWANASIARNE